MVQILKKLAWVLLLGSVSAQVLKPANGGTGSSTVPSADQVPVGNGTIYSPTSVTDCHGTANATTYNTTTHAWGCNTISGSGIGATFPYGGDGSDGSVTADGAATLTCLGAPAASKYTMTRNCYFSSLTVNNGVTIQTNGLQIMVQGTLDNSGTIGFLPTIGSNAGNASGCSGGAAGQAGVIAGQAAASGGQMYNQFIVGVAGGAGATGATGAGAQAAAANAAITVTCFVITSGLSAGTSGSAGGGGGTGSGGAGGGSRSGGTGEAAKTGAAIFDLAMGRTYPESINGRYSLMSGTTNLTGTICNGSYNGGATGGSAGGGNSVNNGGGGGGGGGEGGHGGYLSIYAKTIINEATGVISADGGVGGNGGNGSAGSCGGGSNAGGGGGGAGGNGGVGGILWLFYSSLTNSGTIRANGGVGGTHGNLGAGVGTGTNGSNGADGGTGMTGKVIQIQMQ